jgi:hypothetical protein
MLSTESISSTNTSDSVIGDTNVGESAINTVSETNSETQKKKKKKNKNKK